MALQAYQTLISQLVYIATGTVALCQTDPVSWDQTPMPHHPVEAHFHNKCQECRPRNTTCRVQNPNIPRAGRDGAHGGATGRGRSGLDADRTVRPGNKLPSFPPRRREHIA